MRKLQNNKKSKILMSLMIFLIFIPTAMGEEWWKISYLAQPDFGETSSCWPNQEIRDEEMTREKSTKVR